MNLHQEKLGTERKNYLQTNIRRATYLLYKSQKNIFIFNYKRKIIIIISTNQQKPIIYKM